MRAFTSAIINAASRARLVLLGAVACVGAAGLIVPATAHAAGTGVISGQVWQDTNRNKVVDSGEAPLSNALVYLYDGNGQYVAGAYTDATGAYRFSSLAAGSYIVQLDSSTWQPLQDNWVPTTTTGLRPSFTLTLTDGGSASAPFGIRQIVRSTNVSSPISTYVGSNGLRVDSYDDVVAAKDIYDAVMRGTVGAEAPYVTIRFDYTSSASTVSAYQGSAGSFSNYSAVCYDNYGTWRDMGDYGVSHEYGHAWSKYYDTIVQQQGDFTGYLKARGLYGDPRLNTSYAWDVKEMIAEDYRQLLGSPTAQTIAQMNTDIPPASQVPGLKDYLATTFTTAPTGSTSTTTTSSQTPQLSVTKPVVNPTPVTKTGTVSSTISTTATVTVTIQDSSGALVRTLIGAVGEPAGTVSASWDRLDSRGRRVKSGTYVAVISAQSGSQTATQSSSFSVN